MAQRSSNIIKALEQEIMNGKLTTGERLPSEEKLCDRFGASRTVIREAIQQLRGRGLLRTLKGSGSYIANPSLETLAGAIETYSVLTTDDAYLQLMDLRILLETECAHLASLHSSEKYIAIMKKAIDKMQNSCGDRKRFSEADIAFHLAIAAGSKHSLYATVLSALEKRSIEFGMARVFCIRKTLPIQIHVVAARKNQVALHGFRGFFGLSLSNRIENLLVGVDYI